MPSHDTTADRTARELFEEMARWPIFDPHTGEFEEVDIYRRPDLAPGARISGPAVIAEDETSTVVSPLFDARIDRFGYIELTRNQA